MDSTAALGILVIGNDSHFSYLLRRYIRKSEHRPMLANPADNILSKVKLDKPAAIIIEVDQPGSTGWLALRAIKGCSETAHIPIVVCSWRDERNTENDVAADIFLQMPILYDDFVSALRVLKF
jgi:DNA-binding response OmpR family regulator